MKGGDKNRERESEKEEGRPTVWLPTWAEKDQPCREVIGFK